MTSRCPAGACADAPLVADADSVLRVGAALRLEEKLRKNGMLVERVQLAVATVRPSAKFVGSSDFLDFMPVESLASAGCRNAKPTFYKFSAARTPTS